MKRILLTLIVLLCVSMFSVPGAYAFNMFADGSVWESSYHGIGGSGEQYKGSHREYIQGIDVMDGEKCLCIMSGIDYYNAELMTYLRLDGDKIWFTSDRKTMEWNLLYDFGLQPGETTVVSSGNFPLDSYPGQKMANYHVKCVGVEKDSRYPDVEKMNLEVWLEDTPEIITKGYWLKGIGSQCGLLENVRFDKDGYNTCLQMAASRNDGVCYHKEHEKRAAAGLKAEDMFVVGAKWVELQSGAIGVSDETWLNEEYIDDVEEIEGEECLRLMSQREGEAPVLRAYLKVKGNQVWFMNDLVDKEWNLLYDFDIRPGEYTSAAMPWGGETKKLAMGMVKCIELEKDSQNPDVEKMNINVLENGLYHITYEGEWLKGIGASKGLLYNIYYGIVGGIGSTLMEFSTPELGVVYKHPAAGVKEVSGKESEDNVLYDMIGHRIEAPVSGQMYIRGGKLHIAR